MRPRPIVRPGPAAVVAASAAVVAVTTVSVTGPAAAGAAHLRAASTTGDQQPAGQQAAARQSAGQLALLDGRGDFWHDPRPGGDPYHSVPDAGEQPDLRRVVYTHGSERVRVRFRLVDLTRWGYWSWQVRMRTDEDLRRRVALFRDYDGGGRAAVSWSGPGRCEVRYRVDLGDDTVTVAVPRSCLGGPDTVSFRVRSRYWPTSDDYPWVDVAGTDGYDFGAWSAPVPRG